MSMFVISVTPIISSVSQPSATLLGEPAAIFCLATGYPIPTLTWQLDGVEIAEDNRISIFTFSPQLEEGTIESSGFLPGSDGESISDLLTRAGVEVDAITSLGELGTVSVLSLAGVVREDMGDYTCTASNQLPQTTLLTTSSTVPLVVLGKISRASLSNRSTCSSMLPQNVLIDQEVSQQLMLALSQLN